MKDGIKQGFGFVIGMSLAYLCLDIIKQTAKSASEAK